MLVVKTVTRQMIHRADLPGLGLLAPPSPVSPTVTDGTGKGVKWVAVYMGQELSLLSQSRLALKCPRHHMSPRDRELTQERVVPRIRQLPHAGLLESAHDPPQPPAAQCSAL